MAEKKAKLTALPPSEQPEPLSAIHVHVPNVKSKHVRIDVVYDLDTISYDVGETDGDVDFKFPILQDGGDFFVRVVDVGFDKEGNVETKKLIAKGVELSAH
jgi:hypothetical protein